MVSWAGWCVEARLGSSLGAAGSDTFNGFLMNDKRCKGIEEVEDSVDDIY